MSVGNKKTFQTFIICLNWNKKLWTILNVIMNSINYVNENFYSILGEAFVSKALGMFSEVYQRASCCHTLKALESLIKALESFRKTLNVKSSNETYRSSFYWILKKYYAGLVINQADWKFLTNTLVKVWFPFLVSTSEKVFSGVNRFAACSLKGLCW